jgi:hypothetical protein
VTVEEISQGKFSAALLLYQCRRAGALVLRVHDGYAWRIEVRTFGRKLPTDWAFQLLELEPFALILLRELHTGSLSLPI